MKTLINYVRIAVLAIVFTGVISCGDDDDNGVIVDGTSNTIADIVVNNPDFSSLLAALQQTGLDTTLGGNGNFTVFAPTNAAFETFLGGTALEDVDNDALTQILLNHVLNVELASTDLSTGYQKNLATEPSSGSNIDMYIDTTNGVVVNGQSTVTTADVTADNGIIHIVDTVIELPTIVTFATTNPALSSLVAALTDEGNTTFVNLLSDTNADFTVFAPTNDAFTTFLDGASLSDIDNDVLGQVLSNHVIPGTVAVSSALSNSYVNTAAVFNGETDAPINMYINTDNGVTLNGSSNVALADIVAVNGVVHVVDAVIGLPDVTTFATADPTFSSLVAALTADASFGYVAALQTPNGTDPAPFTVFAPTNDAFADLLTDLGLGALGDVPVDILAATLELHVVAGANVRAEDLSGIDGNAVETLGGGDITIDAASPAIIDPDGGSNGIVVTNVQAANGVIHAISRVIRDL
ncbi:fasciclin domain-containing protein [uncultured Dokdonia sp.]|uniref:fasciclin domain-containing protein n=1 Tax=uncultured Dokdonia sp. TaxID=575653 RepID=UPI002607F530|nr:fasciclin domain-containing protein [uncultured Dokdonia sp.]